VGDEDPYLDQGGGGDPGFNYPHFGDLSDPGGGCTVDGAPWSCSMAIKYISVPGTRISLGDNLSSNSSFPGFLLGGHLRIVYGSGSEFRAPTDYENNVVTIGPDANAYEWVTDGLMLPFAPLVPQNSTQTKQSGCAQFVNHLMNAVDQLGASVTQSAIGVNLALAARSDLAKKAGANTLDYSGFKESLIAGGQNGWAMVHIQGIAGSSLAGYITAIDNQFKEDKNQLKAGLDWKALGRTTIPYGKESNYPVDKFIAERQAEIADDHAGVDVGGALSDKINGRATYLVAKIKILNLLCDK
jgi:hypothetical protein